MTEKRPTQNLSVVYTVKLTQEQRVKLLQLGGPKWIRAQVDAAVVRK
jgi:hypothetical protein